MQIDAIIKSHHKDYVKLPFVIDSLRFVNPQPENIYLINRDNFNPLPDDKRITVFHDDEVFPGTDRSRLRFRPNWCFMSIIGVFQEITKNDYYLDVQSDNIFLQPIDLFENDKPLFFMSPQHSHYHQPYFTFSKRMFDVGREGSDSFIVDFMLYNKNIGREMRSGYKDFNQFFDRICEVTDRNSYIGDYELYPNWCLKYKPGMYDIKKINTILLGNKNIGHYTKEKIDQIINSSHNATAISLHTWADC